MVGYGKTVVRNQICSYLHILEVLLELNLKDQEPRKTNRDDWSHLVPHVLRSTKKTV